MCRRTHRGPERYHHLNSSNSSTKAATSLNCHPTLEPLSSAATDVDAPSGSAILPSTPLALLLIRGDNNMTLQPDPQRVLLIVVGAHLQAEISDRPLAYRLREAVLRWQDEHADDHAQ